jgi:hypothetical protein
MGSGLQKPLTNSLKSIHDLCVAVCRDRLLLDNELEDSGQDNKAEIKRLRGLIKKYRYRTREAFASVLQESAEKTSNFQYGKPLVSLAFLAVCMGSFEVRVSPFLT